MVKFDDSFSVKALKLWNKAVIRPERQAATEKNCTIIIKNMNSYKKVEEATGVPWWWVGIVHGMESDFNLKTWLANGDDLSHPTVNVPAGLICDGSWHDGAIVSIKHEKFEGIEDWSIPHALYLFESWNGWGYLNHGVNSAYVWSGTSEQMPGRFVSDGKWNAEAVSTRAGCVAMLKHLIKIGAVQNGGVFPDSLPMPLPIPENPRAIAKWIINSNDPSDCRGVDADGKVVCWLDTESSLEKLYYGAVMQKGEKIPFSIESMDKKPGSKPVPVPSKPAPKVSDAQKFVEFYKHNYSKVRAKVEDWFVGKHSPSATKNGCVAHVYSCLWLCSLNRPKVDTMESINVDYYCVWALKNGWSKITDMSKLQAGDVCVSGPSQTNIDHVFTFVEYVDANNCYCLDNQKIDLHVRALKNGSCGEFRFAVRMP